MRHLRIPKTKVASVANQKALYLRHRLNKLAKGVVFDKPFAYRHFGSMVYIGSWNSLIDFTDKLSGGTKHEAALTGKAAWICAFPLPSCALLRLNLCI